MCHILILELHTDVSRLVVLNVTVLMSTIRASRIFHSKAALLGVFMLPCGGLKVSLLVVS